MRTGLTITAMDKDLDTEEYRIEASNGYFSGMVYVYTPLGTAEAWADALAGFPRDTADQRQLSCGVASDVAELRLSCVNTSGHAVLEILLTSDEESTRLQFKVQAAALDRFVDELRALTVDSGQPAHLPIDL